MSKLIVPFEPRIGVFIATPGRKSIVRTIHSILAQRLLPGDDVLIVGDGYHEWTDDLIKSVGDPFRYVAIDQTKDWGHSQCNFGMMYVGGDVAVAQDDDDIFAPRAFEEIRIAVKNFPFQPIMARVKTPNWGVLWSKPNVPPFDGHCLIFPNNKEKLGYWSPDYCGDQTYLRTTIDHYDTITWLDKVLTITRPTWKLWYRQVKTLEDALILREIRNTCAEYMTKHTSKISIEEQLDWFNNLDHTNHWYWIFEDETHDIGYVGLNRINDKMYSTYGLIPEARGKGLGRELVEFSQWGAQEELTLEVREDNERAIKLYTKCGFKEHWKKDGIIEMYSEWPPK
jgi:RimJ/RimL family protein N-acetyltransferase